MTLTLSAVIAATIFFPIEVSGINRCDFKVIQPRPSVAPVVGPSEIVARTRIAHDDAAPLVVSAVDFSEIDFVTTPGFYSWRGPHTVEVLNVSDRPITDVVVWVYVGVPQQAFGGKGVRFDKVLRPGERVRLSSRSSRGHGYTVEGEAVVDVVMVSAHMDGCDYLPSYPSSSLRLSLPRGQSGETLRVRRP